MFHHCWWQRVVAIGWVGLVPSRRVEPGERPVHGLPLLALCRGTSGRKISGRFVTLRRRGRWRRWSLSRGSRRKGSDPAEPNTPSIDPTLEKKHRLHSGLIFVHLAEKSRLQKMLLVANMFIFFNKFNFTLTNLPLLLRERTLWQCGW